MGKVLFVYYPLEKNDLKPCVIIPCYNEERRLKVESFHSFLDSNKSIDLLFVNDGSLDKTQVVLGQLEALFENVSVLNLEQNVGKASAIRKGMLHVLDKDYDHIGYFDADLATPLKEIPRFLNIFEDCNIDLVMGTRILRLGGDIQRKWNRHFLGRLFATFASFSLQLPVYDTQC